MPIDVSDLLVPVYKDYARKKAQEIGIPESLFLGYLEHESGWNPYAQNPKSSATGLGQILKNNPWARETGIANFTRDIATDERYDPYKNIDAIAHEMQSKYKKTGSWEGAVSATGENTRSYMNRVRAVAKKYGYTEADIAGEEEPKATVDVSDLLGDAQEAKGTVDVSDLLPQTVMAKEVPYERKGIYEPEMVFEPLGGVQEPERRAAAMPVSGVVGESDMGALADPELVAAAGEKVGQAMDIPFIPLNYVLSKIHQYGMEPLRERSIKDYAMLGQPGTEIAEAAPEALGPLPSEEEFVPVAGIVAAPLYLRTVLKGFQLVGRAGRIGYYRYMPDAYWKARGVEPGPLARGPLSEAEWARLSPTRRAEMMAARATPETPFTAPAEAQVSPEAPFYPPATRVPGEVPAPQTVTPTPPISPIAPVAPETPVAEPTPPTPAAKEPIGDIAERYQWMRNKEGGQEYGNQMVLLRASPDVFKKYIRPRMRDNPTYNQAVTKGWVDPATTVVQLIRKDAVGEWEVNKVGNIKDLRPQGDAIQWAKKVNDFSSLEAQEWGRTADSEVLAEYPGLGGEAELLEIRPDAERKLDKLKEKATGLAIYIDTWKNSALKKGAVKQARQNLKKVDAQIKKLEETKLYSGGPETAETLAEAVTAREGEPAPKVGLAIQKVGPLRDDTITFPGPQKRYTFADPKIEQRYQTAKSGVGTGPGILSRLHEKWTRFLNQFREYETLPETPEFANLRNSLRHLKAARTFVPDRTINYMNAITVDLGPNKFDMFTRAVIVNDLAYMAQARGHEKLPFGFTKDTLLAEKAKIDNIVAANPDIAEAIARRKGVWTELKNQYLAEAEKVGLNVADRFDNPDYYRHIVMDVYAEQGNQGRPPKGPGKRWLGNVASRSYLKKRTEHALDINANYYEAEYDAMAQMLMDLQIMKTITETDRAYNIAPQLKNMAKKKGVEDWRELIPNDYVEWLPRPGRVFYQVYTIPEKIIGQMMAGEATADDVLEKVKTAMAMGRQRKSLVIPREVADTLDNFTWIPKSSSLGKLANEITMGWKVWILTSPVRLLQYNTRNLLGDFNRLFAKEPRALKYVPESITELRKWGQGAPATGDLKEALEHGVIDSTLTLEEIGELGQTKHLERLAGETHQKIKNPLVLWFQKARAGTVFRENILRLAAYKHAKVEYEAGNRILGYSDPKELAAIENDADKVGHVARHLLGDYASVTDMMKTGRRFWVPFGSFQEINLRGWLRGLTNALEEGKSGRYVIFRVAAGGVTLPIRIATKLVPYIVGAAALMLAAKAYNSFFYPKEEKRLSPYDRNRPHLILGRNPDGSVKLFRGTDAFGEFLGLFGLDDAPTIVKQFLNGQINYKQMLTEMAEGGASRLYGLLTPTKSLIEIALKRSGWPNVFRPRHIRDRTEEFFKMFSLDPEYRALTKKPGRPYISQRNFLWSTYNLDEQNYYEIRSLAYEYKRDVLGGGGYSGGDYSAKAQAYYDYKKAILYGDKEAETRALRNIEAAGGTKQGLRTSIRNWHPLAPIKKDKRKDFIKWLSPSQRELLVGATKWYKKLESAKVRLKK